MHVYNIICILIDPLSESRSGDFYVPRDEAFSVVKQDQFLAKTVYSGLQAVAASLQTAIIDPDLGFPYFTAIDTLFNEGIELPPLQNKGCLRTIAARLIKAIEDKDDFLRFAIPDAMDKDKFFWLRDGEFARQTLAGVNPYSIQLVTVCIFLVITSLFMQFRDLKKTETKKIRKVNYESNKYH